jgi:hypothetical protein
MKPAAQAKGECGVTADPNPGALGRQHNGGAPTSHSSRLEMRLAGQLALRITSP